MAKLSTGTPSSSAIVSTKLVWSEAAVGIDGRPRNAEQLEQIAVVGIAIAERDDAVDALRRGRRRRHQRRRGRAGAQESFTELHLTPSPKYRHCCQ